MAQEKKPQPKLTQPATGSRERLTHMQEQIDEVRRLVEENLRYSKNTNQVSTHPSGQVEFKKMLQENLKISKELLGTTRKIKKWIAWQRVWGFLKILIIVVPIILGVIYLPPLLNTLVEPYRELLNFGAPANLNIQEGANNTGLLQQLTEQFLNNGGSIEQIEQIIEAN